MIKMNYPTLTDVETTIDKLRNLREYLPGKHQTVYVFAGLIADVLKAHQGPINSKEMLLLSCEASEPLEKRKEQGIDSLTVALSTIPEIPNIVKATCPEDFAKSLEACLHEDE